MSWQYTSQPLAIRWEYQRLPQTHSREENLLALNEAGAAGWELCHVWHDNFLMKRLSLQQVNVNATYPVGPEVKT